MASEAPDDLDRHLDRLIALAYEGLAGDTAAARRAESAEDRPEQIGPYAVNGLIGRGGTSLVWRAHDPELGREIAIKVLDRRHLPDGQLAQRFLDEARLCSQLAHPGILPIHSLGRLPDGRPYFTMRLVEGETFAARLGGRSDPDDRREEWLEVFSRICETMAFAHARGIVHGDLKPHNVMVGGFGQVQVMDWGFCDWSTRQRRRTTAPSARRPTWLPNSPAPAAPSINGPMSSGWGRSSARS